MLKIMNDFSSIDRLIEFGLSIAVAQQMMNTVNTCIHDNPGNRQFHACPELLCGN